MMHKEMRTRAYRFSGGSPAFPAQWFYGLFRALLGDRAFLPPSSAWCGASSPTWRRRRGVRTTRLRRPHQRRSSEGASRVHRIPPRVSRRSWYAPRWGGTADVLHL